MFPHAKTRLSSSTMRSNSRFVAAVRRTLTRSVLLLLMESMYMSRKTDIVMLMVLRRTTSRTELVVY